MPFRLPPELETERLRLRQWRPDDAEPLAEIYTQPEFLEHMPPRDVDGVRLQIDRFTRGWHEDGYSQWAAEERETRRLIGRIGILCHHDWPLSDRPVPEVGWVLHRDFWGRGLATEGGRAGVGAWREHLRDEPRLISITTEGNRRSQAVMARLGFDRRGATNWRGLDVIWFGLDRDRHEVVTET
jgi:RimJ/RimL family protein N-acetyltransferase